MTQEIDGLFAGGFAQLLAAALQRFIKSDGSVLHALVGLVRTADEDEMFTAADPVVVVLAVQSDAQKPDKLAFAVGEK